MAVRTFGMSDGHYQFWGHMLWFILVGSQLGVSTPSHFTHLKVLKAIERDILLHCEPFKIFDHVDRLLMVV